MFHLVLLTIFSLLINCRSNWLACFWVFQDLLSPGVEAKRICKAPVPVSDLRAYYVLITVAIFLCQESSSELIGLDGAVGKGFFFLSRSLRQHPRKEHRIQLQFSVIV